jgi:hypothetical protein
MIILRGWGDFMENIFGCMSENIFEAMLPKVLNVCLPTDFSSRVCSGKNFRTDVAKKFFEIGFWEIFVFEFQTCAGAVLEDMVWK